MDELRALARLLNISLFSRHDTIAALLDRVVEPVLSRRLSVAATSVFCVLTGSWVLAIWAPIHWLTHSHSSEISSFDSFNRFWFPAMWEFFFWMYLAFMMGTTLIALASPGSVSATLLLDWFGAIGRALLVTYVIAEFVHPPRTRKKREPASAPSKIEYEGMIV